MVVWFALQGSFSFFPYIVVFLICACHYILSTRSSIGVIVSLYVTVEACKCNRFGMNCIENCGRVLCSNRFECSFTELLMLTAFGSS